MAMTSALAGDARPRVAVFPIAGDAPEASRERAGFSLRAKLDRTGKFDVVDGPKMREIVAENNSAIDLASTPGQVRELARLVDADIALWGEYSGQSLRVTSLDLRDAGAAPKAITKTINQPADLRFAIEEILQEIQAAPQFDHPIEQTVWDDEAAKKLWQANPNLLANGDFAQAGHWMGVYRSELYPVAVSDAQPSPDKVSIVRNAGPDGGNAIVLNLSKDCAENNGLAALSDAISIQPNTRYRLQFRYKSDGPVLHVFVKGYTQYPGAAGKAMQREIYRRQVPLLQATKGQWVTVTDDFNPQHVALPVQTIKVDLYAYLHPGKVTFDDVIVKAVGSQTVVMKDKAIKPAATRPAGAGKP